MTTVRTFTKWIKKDLEYIEKNNIQISKITIEYLKQAVSENERMLSIGTKWEKKLKNAKQKNN